MSQKYLNDELRHPADNSGGDIVWGTRYYMESLLDAYEATDNPKYIQAFLDTGNWVMNLAQSMTVLDVDDPSAPGTVFSRAAPVITVTGWPTHVSNFGIPIAVPSQTGQTALYVQNLDPQSNGANYFQVLQQSDGSLALEWVEDNTALETDPVRSQADLNALAARPLVFGTSFGRIKPTGLGLPAPGKFEVDSTPATIWHEQTGGILLPFARFLLLAKENPGLADATTISNWTSKVLAIAEDDDDEFVSDGSGGLRFRNPIWIPNLTADTDAGLDYIDVEATLRLFLYELTGDPHQLEIAKGLTIHQKNFHLQANSRGWLLLKYWPCLQPWSNRADAPQGSIWSSFQFNPQTPAPVLDAGFFVYLVHIAKLFGLAPDIGLTDEVLAENRAAFLQYLIIPPDRHPNGVTSLLRTSYPVNDSRASDPIGPAQDLWAASGFLTPELADESFINANWNWMRTYGQQPDGSLGYFLRAWSRSEVAERNVCKVQ